jgi:hypothetical protein
MEKPNFTPGPWTVGEISDTGGYDCMTAGVTAGPVTLDAADYGQARISDLPYYIEEKMLADAHLIAAAPELYEALAVILDAHDSYLEDVPLARDNPDPISDAIEAARHVLAKARGE